MVNLGNDHEFISKEYIFISICSKWTLSYHCGES